MKFKILCISLLMVVFLFPSICFSGKLDSKVWQHYSDNWYYNKTNLTKSSNIISVWTYKIITNDERKKITESIKKYDLKKAKKYQNLDHLVVLWEIDCKNRLRRIKESIDYDNKEKVLDSVKNLNNEWARIMPNSVSETLYDKICVTQTKPVKKK
ncbi:MAG: surface-adhesin E family protein [Smithella sp.]